MGKYEADLTKVSAGIPVFPKGEYELTIGTPKAFKREGKKGTNFGVGFPLTCVVVHDGDENMKGKKTYYNGFMHTDGSQGFTKQFVMAGYGYVTDIKAENNESAFNDKYAGEDWGFDPDNGIVGDIYKGLEGKRIVVNFGTRSNPEDENSLQQTWDKIRPV